MTDAQRALVLLVLLAGCASPPECCTLLKPCANIKDAYAAVRDSRCNIHEVYVDLPVTMRYRDPEMNEKTAKTSEFRHLWGKP